MSPVKQLLVNENAVIPKVKIKKSLSILFNNKYLFFDNSKKTRQKITILYNSIGKKDNFITKKK